MSDETGKPPGIVPNAVEKPGSSSEAPSTRAPTSSDVDVPAAPASVPPASAPSARPAAAPASPAPSLAVAPTSDTTGPSRPSRPSPWATAAAKVPSGLGRVLQGNGIALLLGLGLATIGVGAIFLRRSSTPEKPTASAAATASAPSPPGGLASGPLVGCGAEPPKDAGDVRVLVARLDAAPIAEVLRGIGVDKDQVYRVRRAFESRDDFRPSAGTRIAVSLRGSPGAIDALEVVLSARDVWRAAPDTAGELAVAKKPEGASSRPCGIALRVDDDVADALAASTLDDATAASLAIAFGARLDLRKPQKGTLRVLARELVALGAGAGYDGVIAAEYAAEGAPPLRVHRFDAGGSGGFYDERGAPSGVGTTPLAATDALSFQGEMARQAALLASLTTPSSAAGSARGAEEPDDDEDDRSAPVEGQAPRPGNDARTVDQAASATCSTRIVSGLSKQIIDEARCLDANAFVRVPSRKNLSASSNVFLYLEAPARDRLLRALDKNPRRKMTVNSALRTIAQQVLLSKWGARKRCGVKLAALPGESNHESGLALDVREASQWRTALEAEGFKWMGQEDPVHFDYQGPGAIDHRGLDVRAFQRLWNRNNPDDQLPVNGKADAATLARVGKSPASGFPTGARCDR